MKTKHPYNAKKDESLGMRRGKEADKSQSMKDRRKESRGMKHADEKQDKALIKKMMKKGCK